MPKYIVTFDETYTATIQHVVEAKDEQEAIDKASDIHAEHVTPVEQINFQEWLVDGVEEYKD